MENLINGKILSHNEMKLLTEEEVKNHLAGLKPGWEILESAKIKRLFNFGDFAAAMEFVNKVAKIAEEKGHHPDILIHYNKVEIVLWSHHVNGLSMNDFIIAANIDAL